MEKENIILKSENKQKSSKSELKLDKEIDRLKREIINERTEKEIIEAKTEFFRNEIKVVSLHSTYVKELTKLKILVHRIFYNKLYQLH